MVCYKSFVASNEQGVDVAKWKLGDIFIHQYDGDVVQIIDVFKGRCSLKVLKDTPCGWWSRNEDSKKNFMGIDSDMGDYKICYGYGTPLYTAMNTIQSTPLKDES